LYLAVEDKDKFSVISMAYSPCSPSAAEHSTAGLQHIPTIYHYIFKKISDSRESARRQPLRRSWSFNGTDVSTNRKLIYATSY